MGTELIFLFDRCGPDASRYVAQGRGLSGFSTPENRPLFVPVPSRATEFGSKSDSNGPQMFSAVGSRWLVPSRLNPGRATGRHSHERPFLHRRGGSRRRLHTAGADAAPLAVHPVELSADAAYLARLCKDGPSGRSSQRAMIDRSCKEHDVALRSRFKLASLPRLQSAQNLRCRLPKLRPSWV
jgi:hypothetical protein